MYIQAVRKKTMENYYNFIVTGEVFDSLVITKTEDTFLNIIIRFPEIFHLIILHCLFIFHIQWNSMLQTFIACRFIFKGCVSRCPLTKSLKRKLDKKKIIKCRFG